MSQKKDKSQTQSWWQTLPGLMTAMGAIITALTGLLIALNQAGIIGSQGQPASSRNNKPSISVPTEAAFNPPTLTPRAPQRPGTPTEDLVSEAQPTDIVPSGPSKATPLVPRPAATPHYPIILASGGEATADRQVYTIMAAQVEHRSTDRLGLRITLRVLNNDVYDFNFWDSSARLIVDGLPVAPIEAPDALVNGQAYDDEVFLFELPTTAKTLELQVGQVGQETSIIHIDLTPAQP